MHRTREAESVRPPESRGAEANDRIDRPAPLFSGAVRSHPRDGRPALRPRAVNRAFWSAGSWGFRGCSVDERKGVTGS